MASIKQGTKTLFFTTSPRTASKMKPEIDLLIKNFKGKNFTNTVQAEFMKLLVNSDFYESNSPVPKDLALAARDRITRAPKALGFVKLFPIEITDAGYEYIYSINSNEALLRQLLKFQLPSPYHTLPDTHTKQFNVKPYLEILRLVYDLKTLSFDELRLFGVQLTDYNDYEQIKDKILKFRELKEENKGQYKALFLEIAQAELSEIYADEIQSGRTKTRESDDKSQSAFFAKKLRNLRDYADACVRYLRETGIVSISNRGRTLSIPKLRLKEVQFILNTISRDPVYINDTQKYIEYLGDAHLPKLLTDNTTDLISSIHELSNNIQGPITLPADLNTLSINDLKKIKLELLDTFKVETASKEISNIQQRDNVIYEDIKNLFNEIKNRNSLLYDRPLMLEYNTWRAMNYLSQGNVVGHFKRDDNGEPMSTASGNTADIVGYYSDFDLTVEVTLQAGQKQFEAEGESVARHLGKHKQISNKADSFCLFIAPKINESVITYFYTLHQVNLKAYGGKSVIVPISIDLFMKMMEVSSKSQNQPNDAPLRKIFETSMAIVQTATDEEDWYQQLQKALLKWTDL